MIDLFVLVLQLFVVASLLALAVSLYFDGLGYLVLHSLAVAGVGAYVFAVLTTRFGWTTVVGSLAAVGSAAVVGLLIAEAIRSLRGDGLTLATFGIGVAAFELFRYLHVTGGVFGISAIPSLAGSGGWIREFFVAIGVLLLAVGVVVAWRRSVGGMVVVALRMDEWAAVSIGARLASHQRATGLLAGGVAGLAGIFLASSTHFIEPRDFQVSATLIPLAAAILTGGRTPVGVVLVAGLVVLVSQVARFVGWNPVTTGPITEIVLAAIIGSALLLSRFSEVRREHARG